MWGFSDFFLFEHLSMEFFVLYESLNFTSLILLFEINSLPMHLMSHPGLRTRKTSSLITSARYANGNVPGPRPDWKGIPVCNQQNNNPARIDQIDRDFNWKIAVATKQLPCGFMQHGECWPTTSPEWPLLSVEWTKCSRRFVLVATLSGSCRTVALVSSGKYVWGRCGKETKVRKELSKLFHFVSIKN